MTSKGYTFGYYVSGHGFGHATRVNQIITELLKSTTTSTTTAITSTLSSRSYASSSVSTLSTTGLEGSKSQHTIYIVSDAPEFIFQDVIALGAIYRNAKVDAGVVQPVAYYVDRQKTIDGCKQFLSKRDELIEREVAWLAQVGVDCVLADAPFLPCAAASAYGIPAILITNFTFDEVYRYLQEGDDFDKDVIACADAALEDYKKASLLLRLPGFIDIPSFGNEVVAMESSRSSFSSISDMDDSEVDIREQFNQQQQNQQQAVDLSIRLAQKKKQQEDGEAEHDMDHHSSVEENMDNATPTGILSPISMRTALSSPNPSINIDSRLSLDSSPSFSSSSRLLQSMTRKAIDVPLVVRMAVNTREVVLRSLGMDEETIATKKVALVSFGGQSLKEGWGNPLPEGWVGVICGLPADYEMPVGFYRSPHGVYVPDLTEAADVIIGKLGYGTCSECIGHNTPLIYVPRPQFVEEHGLIKMMNNHGLAVEMTQQEFESGEWQRAILEVVRQVEEEKEMRRSFAERCRVVVEEDDEVAELGSLSSLSSETNSVSKIELKRRHARSGSVTSLSEFRSKGTKMARYQEQQFSESYEEEEDDDEKVTGMTLADMTPSASVSPKLEKPEEKGFIMPSALFKRRIPNNGGEVCARLIEEFMSRLGEEEA